MNPDPEVKGDPRRRLPGVDTLLAPEMKSTGEVMGIANRFGMAFAKAEEAAANPLPSEGTVLVSVRREDKAATLTIPWTELPDDWTVWRRQWPRTATGERRCD